MLSQVNMHQGSKCTENAPINISQEEWLQKVLLNMMSTKFTFNETDCLGFKHDIKVVYVLWH